MPDSVCWVNRMGRASFFFLSSIGIHGQFNTALHIPSSSSPPNNFRLAHFYLIPVQYFTRYDTTTAAAIITIKCDEGIYRQHNKWRNNATTRSYNSRFNCNIKRGMKTKTAGKNDSITEESEKTQRKEKTKPKCPFFFLFSNNRLRTLQMCVQTCWVSRALKWVQVQERQKTIEQIEEAEKNNTVKWKRVMKKESRCTFHWDYNKRAVRTHTMCVSLSFFFSPSMYVCVVVVKP